jgi:lipopolysaccharide transport system ATP-binding protein
MTDIVIKAENLGKKYTIGHQAEKGGYTSLRDVLMQNARTLWNKTKDLATGKPIIHGDTMEEVWALKDVNFEIRRGEAVGIIGHNGAGKSTLLKILSRITEPSTGRVAITGRVASLLEVGTGFHPELTGRENIYLNGTILGMTRIEIKQKFDEIVAFAEVEKFLDTPVKRYSSGMYVRLAFAIAAHLKPEILVVDEVLAVGDTAFQKKCIGRMGDAAREGNTVLFVSHNMAAISTLCLRGVLLNAGSVKFIGSAVEAIQTYLGDVSAIHNDLRKAGARILTKIEFINNTGCPSGNVLSGEKGIFRVHYDSVGQTSKPQVSLSINTLMGIKVVSLTTAFAVGRPLEDIYGRGFFDCEVESLPLSPNIYRINVAIHSGSSEVDNISGAMELRVLESNYLGRTRMPTQDAGLLIVKDKWRQYCQKEQYLL